MRIHTHIIHGYHSYHSEELASKMARLRLSILLCFVLGLLVRNVNSELDNIHDDILEYLDQPDIVNRVLPDVAEEVRPGLLGRITQHGLDFAANLGTRILMKTLSTLTIPDVNHNVGTTDVTISNIKVEQFPKPDARLYPIPWPGYGLRWHAYNINPTITANYTAAMELAFWTITKKGTVIFTGQDMYMSLDFFVGVDDRGRPVPEVLSCKSDGKIKIKFIGDWSDMLNVGSSFFSQNIRSLVTAQICFQAKNEITSKLASQLQSLPLTATIKENYLLDLSLLAPPTFDENSVDIPFTGTIYDKQEPQEPPFSPPEIGEHADHDDRMIYLYATSYIVNSALNVLYEREALKYDVTPQMVPAEFRKYMNTTCPGYLCLGTVFPQLPKLFPKSVVSVGMRATSSPDVSIDGAAINITAHAEAEAFVTNVNNTRNSLFVIDVDFEAGFELDIQDQQVFFKISFIEPHADIKTSYIGDIGTGFMFEGALRVVAQEVLIPRLSEFGIKGISLPKMDGLEFLKTTIVPYKTRDVFVIGTDIEFAVKKKRVVTARRRAFLDSRRAQRQNARRI